MSDSSVDGQVNANGNTPLIVGVDGKKRGILVFIVDNIFPYYSGGREVWLYAVAKRLSRHFEVWIYAQRPERPIPPKFNLDGLNIKFISVPAFSKATLGIPHYGTLLANLMFCKWVALSVRYRFGRGSSNNTKRAMFIGLNAGTCYLSTIFMRGPAHRRICNVHGKWEMEMSRLYPPFKCLFKLMGRTSYRDCHMIMASGWADLEHIRQNAGIENALLETKLVPVPLAVELGPFLRASPQLDIEELRNKYEAGRVGKKTITMCATLSVIKGVPELIRAIPRIRENYGDGFVVRFVGKGDSEPFKKLARELGVEKFVEFIGEKARLDLIPEIQMANVIACNFGGGGGPPASLLEAMAVGKPVIAWDTPMYNHTVKSGENGLLVPENDSEALADGVVTLLKDEELARRISAAAKKDAAHYDIDSFISQLEDVLESLWDKR